MSATTCASDGPVIGQPVRGLSSNLRVAIGDRERELGLANIDRDDDRRGRDWSSLNNHGTHLRGCQKATAQQRQTFR